MTIPEIHFRAVGKRFSSASAPVLEGINLSIERGEFVSIIGPSGCGKSTLLKLVAGLSPCSQGEIQVNGMTPANAREIVSFIFQDATLLPWRTVQKNVALALELEGRTRDETATTTEKLLATRWPLPCRRTLSAPALRRNEDARFHRPSPRDQAKNSPDG